MHALAELSGRRRVILASAVCSLPPCSLSHRHQPATRPRSSLCHGPGPRSAPWPGVPPPAPPRAGTVTIRTPAAGHCSPSTHPRSAVRSRRAGGIRWFGLPEVQRQLMAGHQRPGHRSCRWHQRHLGQRPVVPRRDRERALQRHVVDHVSARHTGRADRRGRDHRRGVGRDLRRQRHQRVRVGRRDRRRDRVGWPYSRALAGAAGRRSRVPGCDPGPVRSRPAAARHGHRPADDRPPARARLGVQPGCGPAARS
jgi:hypothetical protein